MFDTKHTIYSGKEQPGEETGVEQEGPRVDGARVLAARDVKQMSLEAVVKTSGKTGLHVFVR